MSMPPKLKAKYLDRFSELIDEGERVIDSVEKTTSGGHVVEGFYGRPIQTRRVVKTTLDFDAAMEFQNKSQTLLASVLPTNHPNRTRLGSSDWFSPQENAIRATVAFLKATKDDLEHGFLDSLSSQFESEISSDYLGQAESLLGNGSTGQHEFVPAAVLAGAVLERSLRTLCANQSPPIPTVRGNGEPMTLNPLIDELKKAGVFNELKAKQLRSWADIRNAAAHGEWQKFSRSDVETMLAGVSSFLADAV